MMHFSCDVCGKDLTDGAARYVVKMEAFAAAAPAGLTEADLDADPVAETAQLLSELEDADGGPAAAPPARAAWRFDLCPGCFRKFHPDPLGREAAAKFDFSEN